MSERCFKIFGNLQRNGMWKNPESPFMGYFVVNENGTFQGYVEVGYDPQPDCDPLRFVTGVYDETNYTLAYFELASSRHQAPLIYSLTGYSGFGLWYAIEKNGVHERGDARVSIVPADMVAYRLEKIQMAKAQIVDNGPVWNKCMAAGANNMAEILQCI